MHRYTIYIHIHPPYVDCMFLAGKKTKPFKKCEEEKTTKMYKKLTRNCLKKKNEKQ